MIFRSLYRWLLERMFIWVSPNGHVMLEMIKYDLFSDIYSYIVLSMQENPDKWKTIIDDVNKTKGTPNTQHTKELFHLMQGLRYLSTSKHYTLVKQTHDPLGTIMDANNDPNDKKFH